MSGLVHRLVTYHTTHRLRVCLLMAHLTNVGLTNVRLRFSVHSHCVWLCVANIFPPMRSIFQWSRSMVKIAKSPLCHSILVMSLISWTAVTHSQHRMTKSNGRLVNVFNNTFRKNGLLSYNRNTRNCIYTAV